MRRAVHRRRMDDLHLHAERGRRHAVRPPTRPAARRTRFRSASEPRVLRRLALRRLFRESAERARRTRWSRRRWRSRRAARRGAGTGGDRADSSCSTSRRGDKYRCPTARHSSSRKARKYLAVRANKANAAAKHNGADLVLRDLATGVSQNIGNVELCTISTTPAECSRTPSMPPSAVGNGVYVVDLATSQSTVLSSATLDYDQLTWSDKGASLAVLRGDKKKENLQRDNALLVWQDVDAPRSRAPPSTTRRRMPAFPKTIRGERAHAAALGARRLARLRRPQGAGGTSRSPATEREPQANVDVWHWKDTEVQSVQMVRLAQERRADAAGRLQRREQASSCASPTT